MPPWSKDKSSPAGGPIQRLKALWSERRGLVLAVAGTFAAIGVAAGVALYLATKDPDDVSNPDVAFDAGDSQKQPRKVKETDWPVYGLNPARTRYLPARGLNPPFRVAWQFKARNLMEFSPILAGDSLYAVNNNGLAFALNKNNGKGRWLKDRAVLNASSPAFARNPNTIYVATLDPGKIQAINTANGNVRWQRDLPARSESSPVVIGDVVYFGCECGILYAFDRKTGETKWETQIGGPVKAAPAFSEGVLYVGDYAGQVTAVNAANGDIKWQTSQGGRFYSTPAVAFGRVYIGNVNGSMYSFNKQNGQLAWAQGTGDFVYAAPAVADTPRTPPTVYFGSYDGNFYALDARSGATRWSSPAGGKVSGAASVIGEIVYVANLDTTETYAYNVRTGQRVFRFRDGAYNPVVSDGKRIYLTGVKRVYALRPLKPTEPLSVRADEDPVPPRVRRARAKARQKARASKNAKD